MVPNGEEMFKRHRQALPGMVDEELRKEANLEWINVSLVHRWKLRGRYVFATSAAFGQRPNCVFEYFQTQVKSDRPDERFRGDRGIVHSRDRGRAGGVGHLCLQEPAHHQWTDSYKGNFLLVYVCAQWLHDVFFLVSP